MYQHSDHGHDCTGIPDLNIWDVMMPDLSDLEVLRIIHRKPGRSSIPIVLVSAKAAADDVGDRLYADASIYLTKWKSCPDLKIAIGRLTQGV